MDPSRTVTGTIGIETERLRLRQWVASDLEPFAALNADPRVMERPGKEEWKRGAPREA